jgi:dienelactone hydrolase
MIRTAVALSVLVALAATLAVRAEDGPAWDRKKAKAAEAFATKWWKARPKTKFDEWDPKVRQELEAEAKAFGAIPEGKLEDVVEALFKPAKKFGPRHGSGKPKLDTPYGEATFIVNGSGKNKGLIIGLHGGGPGAGSAGEATKWKMKGCMGMYPQGIRLEHDTWNTVHGERFVLTLIEIAKAQYDVDPDRVFCMGFSMGGTGSWFMAGRHPDLLAGAIPAHGVLMASPQSQVETKEEVAAIQHGFVPNVRDLALWYYTGLADRNCMPGTYLYVNDLIEDLKKSDPGGYEKVHFKAYPGVAHSFPPGEPGKGYAFLEDQVRDTFPKKFVYEYATKPYPPATSEDKTDRYQKRYIYWVKCDRMFDRQAIRAQIEDNVITLDAALRPNGAKGITIFLNDQMIDPAKDVVVKVSGDEVYRGKPVPDLFTVMETLDARVDKKMVFDRRIEL